MRSDNARYKLIETTSFFPQSDASIHVHCVRENHAVDFVISQNIKEFMIAFTEYQTIEQAAKVLSAGGYDVDQVKDFAKKVFNSPLSNCFKQGLHFSHPKDICESLGYKMISLYRNTKYSVVVRIQSDEAKDFVLRAIKVQRSDQEYLYREEILLEELSLLSKLSNLDNVITASLLQNEKYTAILYPYVEGVSLKKYVHNKLTLDERVKLSLTIYRAFIGMHGQGILHGDIHPSNILICDKGIPTIIDFDCSYEINGKHAKRIGGVPHFLPPENTFDLWYDSTRTKPIDYDGENYQLGLLVYYCLTAKLLFDEGSFTDLMKSIQDDEGRWVRETPEGDEIDSEILMSLKWLTNKTPNLRQNGRGLLLNRLLHLSSLEKDQFATELGKSQVALN